MLMTGPDDPINENIPAIHSLWTDPSSQPAASLKPQIRGVASSRLLPAGSRK